MRQGILDILCCPICKSNLNLKIKDLLYFPIEETQNKFRALFLNEISLSEKGEHRKIEEIIVNGALTCDECHVFYPIFDSVPRMLTYSTGVANKFLNKYSSWINQNLQEYSLPQEKSPPGELEVLSSFSTEWMDYEWTDENYWAFTPESLFRTMEYALGLGKHNFNNKLVLEVGIGIGGIANYLSMKHECNIIGIDLSYAVDKANNLWSRNPRLNIVQASVFALPFKEKMFDIIYSQGVLHHTYNTHLAFNSFSKMAKDNNSMAYIWVYGHAGAYSSIVRRIKTRIVDIVRPIICRCPTFLQTLLLSPIILSYIIFQNYIRRLRLGKSRCAKYGWNAALHAARDSFTPPFVNRHTYQEVCEWFREEGFDNLEILKDESDPNAFLKTIWENTGVRGVRRK